MKSNIQLILAALIWGCAFVAQSVSMDYIGPWTFNCVRFLIGGITLTMLIPLLDRIRGNKEGTTWNNPVLYRAGLFCGLALAAASMVQQIGIMYTTVGKAGFITALYVVIVPFLSRLKGNTIRGNVWAAALIAVAGLYLLSMSGVQSLTRGDLFLLGCAFLFAVHIMIIDHFGPSVDGIRLSCLQFYAAGLICCVGMFLKEQPVLSDILAAAVPILYAGVMSCGAAYTLQITGQLHADPSVASILLSLESVFALLAGFVLLHQVLTVREVIGCVLMFAAIMLAQK